MPTWWSDAKLGIFVHWTPASVAGFAPPDGDPTGRRTAGLPDPLSHTPYTEWYQNSLRFPDSPVARFHREHFGRRPYAELADDFCAGLAHWDPDEWAEQFARAGARYVVLVTKHHDGFCLWPSAVPHPRHPRGNGWHTRRDVVGELAAAVRRRGLRFGVYYSGGLDWTFDDRPLGTFADVVASVPGSAEYADYAEAHVRELIARYRPSVLWNDIAWPFGGRRLWRLFADYYEAVPDGVVNDRWMPRSAAWEVLRARPARRALDMLADRASGARGMIPPKPPHFGVRTPEYTTFDHVPADPWETCRGMDRSFGFNRASRPADFVARDELLGMFADVVAKGGNLLLNVGPRGEDATIPAEQLHRLEWLGEWLAAASPAVVGTRPWVRQQATSPEGHRLRFTARGDDVHVLLLDGPPDRVTLREVAPGSLGSIQTADGRPLPFDPARDGSVRVDLAAVPAGHPWPLALTVVGAEALPTPPPV